MAGEPTTIVVFGATGDLIRRKLIPALGVMEFGGLASRIGEWDMFAKSISYVQGDLETPEDYVRLKQWLDHSEGGSGGNRLFYLSVAPGFSEAPSPIWVAPAWGARKEDGGG